MLALLQPLLFCTDFVVRRWLFFVLLWLKDDDDDEISIESFGVAVDGSPDDSG